MAVTVPLRRSQVLGAFCSVALFMAACSGASSQPPASSPGSPGSPAPGTCPEAPAVNGTPSGWDTASQKPTRYPTVITAPSYCGDSRFLFSFLSVDNRPIGSPDLKAKIAFYDLGRDPSKVAMTADGTFIWAVQGERGIYKADVAFPESGLWGAEFTTTQSGGPTEVTRFVFEVRSQDPTVGVGDQAPSVKTPTARDAGDDLRKISTDAHPDPHFYELSVDQALAQHKPFVLIFATPAFCRSAQCGPTLDAMKTFAKGQPSIAFIHVEPYQLEFKDGRLQPVLDANGQLQATQPTDTWGLTSEPWIFVVSKSGVVTGSFDLIASNDELKAAIDKAV